MKKLYTTFTSSFNSKLNLIFKIILILNLLNFAAYAQLPTPPLKLGQSIVTSYDPVSNSPVVRVFETRKSRPPFISGGTYWIPKRSSGVDWTNSRIGDVYGIAIDDNVNPNIFVSRTTVYCGNPTTLPGLIYKIDGATWSVSDYIVKNSIAGPPGENVNWLRNTGPGLGNLCYDKWHKQLFVTNFEDGRIYRIKDNFGVGEVKSWFPQVADDISPGFVPRGLRLWGIGVFGTNPNDVRVYYSIWNSDKGHETNVKNEIRSIALDYNGEFINSTDRHEIYLPVLGNDIGTTHLNYSNPISDIEFSFKGNMLLGERTMYKRVQPPEPGPYFPYDDMGPCDHGSGIWSHESRIFEYKRDQLGKYNSFPPIKNKVGALPDAAHYYSGCGGVDFNYYSYDSVLNLNSDCDSLIFGSGDALLRVPPSSGNYVYGVAVTDRSSGGINGDYIDIDGDITDLTNDKNKPGDVDVYRKDLCSDTNTCMTIIRDTTYCDSTDTYIYEFQVRNNSYTKNLEQLEILVNSPQPPNYVVTLPSTFNVTPALPPRGASQVYKVKLIGPGAVAYAEVCYTLSAVFEHDDCPWCCFIENCIKLPICNCAEVLLDSVYCSGDGYAYKFKLQNGTQYNVTKIQLSSPGSIPVTFVPQTFNFGTPIAPGQLFPTLTAQMIGGAAGQTIPVRIKLFSGNFECCYFELSYTLPPCDTLFMNLKSFIEGRYDPVTNSMVGDNIEVELRNNYPPYELVETAAGYLSSSGTASLEFYNAVNGVNYYIVLKNNSTLETWSKSPGQSFSSDVLNFDFLTDTQAYGANLELIDSTPLYFGILSGDVNQDGQIDLFDVVMIYNDASAFITGNSDLNGDGVTDLSDIMISNNNALNFESVIRP